MLNPSCNIERATSNFPSNFPLDKHKAGRTISWDDVAIDIGDDIRATIQKCQSAITRS